jgi:hypothetical protein
LVAAALVDAAGLPLAAGGAAGDGAGDAASRAGANVDTASENTVTSETDARHVPMNFDIPHLLEEHRAG